MRPNPIHTETVSYVLDPVCSPGGCIVRRLRARAPKRSSVIRWIQAGAVLSLMFAAAYAMGSLEDMPQGASCALLAAHGGSCP